MYLSIHMYVCIYTYVCKYMYECMYVWVYIYIYIYACICIYLYAWMYVSTCKYIHHHHHHVVPLARISLTLSRHFSLSFIASGRSSGLHPVSSHSCCMYVRAGRPAFARPYVEDHRSTSLMSSSLLLQQCPACLVRLTWIFFVIGGRWPYSWCLVGGFHQDLAVCRCLFRLMRHCFLGRWICLPVSERFRLGWRCRLFDYSTYIPFCVHWHGGQCLRQLVPNYAVVFRLSWVYLPVSLYHRRSRRR